MAQYNRLNVKLSNSQLNKFESAIKKWKWSSFRSLRDGYGRPSSSASQNNNEIDF